MASVGIVETRGYAAALAAADAMKKAATVEIYTGGGGATTPTPIHSHGIFAIVIRANDVGSVKASAEAGAEAAKPLGGVVSVHVIALAEKASVQAALGAGVDIGAAAGWA
jgi:ethanolamine utilization protein EutM